MTENMTMYHDKHLLVLNRPKGMRLGKALVRYGLYQLWNEKGCAGRRPVRQYHEWMKDWKDNLYVGYGMHTNMQLAKLLNLKKVCTKIKTNVKQNKNVPVASVSRADIIKFIRKADEKVVQAIITMLTVDNIKA
jgi:hypothetical protein